MTTAHRDDAIKKIIKMSPEQVATLLVFMAGMDAERELKEHPRNDPPKQSA